MRILQLWLRISLAAALAGPGQDAPVADPRVAELVRQVSAARIEADVRRLAAFGTRHTLSATEDPVRGIGAATSWLRGQFDQIAKTSDGRMRVELDTFTAPAGPRLPKETPVTNVVATLPGSDERRSLVISSHLDSRCTNALDGKSDAPGADDNASGVAAVLETARLLAPRKLRATVVFIAFGAEEQGLFGSRHWAGEARKAGRNVEADLNNDIIGSSVAATGERDDRRVRLFSEGVPAAETPEAARRRVAAGTENDSPSRLLARAVADAQRRYLPGFAVTLVYRRDRYLRGGDHVSFNDAGYAAVRFTEVYEDWRHQHQDVRVSDGAQMGDLPRFVDYGYAANVTRANLAALADLAWAPPPPANVRLLARLAAGTDLRWDTPTDPDRLGFEVLWRDTTSPDWQGSLFVGETNEAHLPHSKDDTLFAVRAVTRAGNRSLPAFPTPGRAAPGTE